MTNGSRTTLPLDSQARFPGEPEAYFIGHPSVGGRKELGTALSCPRCNSRIAGERETPKPPAVIAGLPFFIFTAGVSYITAPKLLPWLP